MNHDSRSSPIINPWVPIFGTILNLCYITYDDHICSGVIHSAISLLIQYPYHYPNINRSVNWNTLASQWLWDAWVHTTKQFSIFFRLPYTQMTLITEHILQVQPPSQQCTPCRYAVPRLLPGPGAFSALQGQDYRAEAREKWCWWMVNDHQGLSISSVVGLDLGKCGSSKC